jgi:hypothetical protein
MCATPSLIWLKVVEDKEDELMIWGKIKKMTCELGGRRCGTLG